MNAGFFPPEALAWFAPSIALLLALTGAGFLLRFVLPGLLLARELDAATRRLRQLVANGDTAPDSVAANAMRTPRLATVWREYAQTLHRQKATPPTWRATAAAEHFFTEHVLVDTPLKTEFYKHLPGILTGIGILGTFSGLILGLSQFAVSSDAGAVRGSLNALIHSVGHAFQVSAAAIALAMLFTWIEKSLVTALYRRVTVLVQTVDGLYEGGSGEDYLARLVQSSEASARQAAGLREALVDAVRQSLGDLAKEMREAQARQQQQLAGDLAKAVVDGLREPMQRLGASIERAGANPAQSLAAHLDATLTRFAGHLERQAAAEADAAVRRQEDERAQTGMLLRELSQQVARLGGEIERSGTLTRQGAERIAHDGRELNDGLARGSAQIVAACGELAATVRGMGVATAQLAESGRRIENAATALTHATTREQETLAAHERLQESLAHGLTALRTTVDAARREAALSADLIARLEAGTQQLARAERAAESYLAEVNAVLGEAHAAFARGVEQTLHTGNAQFQRELAEAVEHLKGVIDELGDALDTAVARV